MVRISWALLAGLWLALLTPARAADAKLDGTWKVTFFPAQEQAQTLWYVTFRSEGGKTTGKVPFTGQGVPATSVEDVSVQGDRVRFALKLGPQSLTFEGKMAEGDKQILGSLNLRNLMPARLDRTPVV